MKIHKFLSLTEEERLLYVPEIAKHSVCSEKEIRNLIECLNAKFPFRGLRIGMLQDCIYIIALEAVIRDVNINEIIMQIKLSLSQMCTLKHILKKGFAAYVEKQPELDEMVEIGLLTKSIGGPFYEIVYKSTDKGYEYAKLMSILP